MDKQKRRYSKNPENRKGTPEDPERCIHEVWPRRWPFSRQCYRKRGHGPDGLYCKQHAKMQESR